MESRQVLTALAVATLVFGAGCGGLLGGNESGGSTPTATPANATTEPTPLRTANGTLDTAALLAIHNETVRAAGTFTRVATIRGGASGTLTTTLRANTSTGAVRATIDAADGTTAVYVNPSGTQYIRQERDGGTNYYVVEAGSGGDLPDDVWEVTADPATNPISSGVVPQLTRVRWTYRGNTTDGGTTLMRFTATGVNATSQYDASSASSFDAELLVDPNRGIRELNTTARIDQQGSTQRLTTVVRYSNIGSTTVDAPDWLDTARARSG